MSASEATTHKDHHAQEEAVSLARKRELMSAEEVAVDKDRHAQAEAESSKKRRTSMTPGELAADKDRHTQQWKAQTARNQVRAQVSANRRNEPDITRQQEEDAAKKRAEVAEWDPQWCKALLDAHPTKRIRLAPIGRERGTKTEHDDLHKELEQELYTCHEKLGSTGSSMLTCGSCGRRHPDVTLESC